VHHASPPFRRERGAPWARRVLRTAGLLLAFLLVGSLTARAQQLDDPAADAHIHAGIERVYNLAFDSAATEFQAVVRDHPDHPAGYFFLAMIDWWRIVSDISNTANDDRFLEKLDKVIELCEARLDKNEDDLTALFYKGGALGFQGRLYGNRGDWIKAANAGRNALPIVQRTYALAPANSDVLFGIGIYNYYAELVPEIYPFVKPFMIFFPKGDRTKGIAQLRTAAAQGRYANTEASYFLLQLLYNFEKDYAGALPLATGLHARYPNNPLFHRYVGRVAAAMENASLGEATWTEILEAVGAKKRGYDGTVEREARYYAGVGSMNARRYDEALGSFYRCDELSRKLDKEEHTGFMVMANLRIGMIYDLQGKRDLALKQYDKVLGMKDFQKSHDEAERYQKTPYQRS
jgi:tetratricopeptide (TPR) repeat protein